jgi:hypothetical protein
MKILAPTAWLLATSFCVCSTALSAQPSVLPPKENFHLFLLIGQSNMAGRGTVEPQDRVPHPRVLMLNKDGEWVPAVDPIHFDKGIAGVGLGRTFGIEVADATPGATIGLIPCAIGGTHIDAWQPGALDAPTKTHPWDDAMRRAKPALAAGTLKGILWHQGESDAKRDLAPAYAAKLAALITRLRTELDAPDVPFIAGQLGQFTNRPWDEFQQQLDQTLRDLPNKVPRTAFVSAEGLTDRGDKLHFNAESYREFGKRYAAAYLKLVNKPAAAVIPAVPLFVPAGTPPSVQMAVMDLQRDLQKTLGAPSPIITNSAELQGRTAIVILGPGDGAREWHDGRIAGREAHGIHVCNVDGAAQIILEGADPRGTIYAIYSFSDEFLGVPPLWYWTGWKPTLRSAINVPGDTERIFPPAYVRWRAWFNNDDDYLNPWRERSPTNDRAVYETVLRLKYNTYEINSVADFRIGAPRYAVDPDAAGAHARGLVITHHHTSPLGSRPRNWEAFWQREGRAPPPFSVHDTASLKAFWRYHAETAQRAGFEQVWTAVFRGAIDAPFWQTFKDAPTNTAARAQIIGDMLQAQVAIVKEVTGDPAPNMRTTLYNEGSKMFAEGLLHPPEDPTLIWNFVAARRDHFPAEDMRNFHAPPGRLLGYYLNFQFTSSGSHLAAAEGPWKMAANYRTVDSAGTQPLAFTVVNAGNIREHLTELSANADMMWRFKEFDADAFLRRYCARYFGTNHANEIATLYRDYYQAYWQQKPSDIPGFERQYLFQDERYSRAIEMLLKDMANDVNRPNPLDGHPLDQPDTGGGYFRVELQPGDADQVAALLRGTAESQDKFSAVAAKAEALRSQLAPQDRVFFDDNLAVRALLMVQLNIMLHETTLAYLAHSQPKERREHLEAALHAADAIQTELDTTEHDSFAHWYDSDQHFGLAPLRDRLRQEISRLK